MEMISRYKGWIMVVSGLVLLVVLVLINVNKTSDDQSNNNSVSAVESQTSDDVEGEPRSESGDVARDEADAAEDAKDVYTYIAQPGDSYSVLARKAVQSYGIVESVDLRRAQIIAAETRLTIDAGSVELNQGQDVVIDRADVVAAVEAAQKISDDEIASWQTYVADVEFDTSRNGEEA